MHARTTAVLHVMHNSPSLLTCAPQIVHSWLITAAMHVTHNSPSLRSRPEFRKEC